MMMIITRQLKFLSAFSILIIEFVNFNESILTEEPKRVARNELI